MKRRLVRTGVDCILRAPLLRLCGHLSIYHLIVLSSPHTHYLTRAEAKAETSYYSCIWGGKPIQQGQHHPFDNLCDAYGSVGGAAHTRVSGRCPEARPRIR
eukprot:2057590-Pyramimonas_sp.AAC.1